MPITSIARDWGVGPSIVRITTTDSLATVLADGYITTQQVTAIPAVNFGTFEFIEGDFAAIVYNGGQGMFAYNPDTLTFDAIGPQNAIVHLTTAQVFAMSATPVLIVPNPGLNRAALPFTINGVGVFNSVQFAGGGAIGLEYGSTALLAGPAASTTLAAATFNGYAASNIFPLTPDVTDTVANIANKGIYVSNTVGAFTTGDGSLILNVGYNIVPTA